MSTLERRILKSIIELKNISVLQESNINTKMFTEEKRHKYIFEFIIDHFKQYGFFPNTEQINEKFDIDLNIIEISFTFEQYATEIKRKFLLNKIEKEIFPSIKTYIKKDELTSVIKYLCKFLSEIEELTNKDGLITTLQENTEKRLKEYIETKNRRTIEIGLPLPWDIVNKRTFGIMKSEMWIIAAKQSVGKTWIAINIANHIWKQGHNVLFISLESPISMIIKRWDALHAKIPYEDLRGARLTQSEEGIYIKSLETIKNIEQKAYIVGDGKVKTPFDIQMILQDHKDVDIIIIDGMYFLNMNNKIGEKYLQVSAVAHAIQQIGLDTGIPTISTTQFTRGGTDEDDIAYSQDIVRCADVVIGAYSNDNIQINKQRFIKFIKTRDSQPIYFMINFDLNNGNLNMLYETDKSMQQIY